MDNCKILYLKILEDSFNQKIGQEIVQATMQMLGDTNMSKNN